MYDIKIGKKTSFQKVGNVMNFDPLTILKLENKGALTR